MTTKALIVLELDVYDTALNGVVERAVVELRERLQPIPGTRAVQCHAALADPAQEWLDWLFGVDDDPAQRSDGFHTFAELYEHRHALFAALATARPAMAWRSRRHDDGSMFPGMFVAGMDLPNGTISYHLPLDWWDAFDGVDTLDRAPVWDGYTPADVVQRLRDWTTAEAADYAPTRWWRVLDSDGKLWCESSNEQENRKALRNGYQLQRLFKQERSTSEWRDQ